MLRISFRVSIQVSFSSLTKFKGSTAYRQFFKRANSFDTTIIQMDTLIFYLISNLLGFVFVNVSNLNFYRGSPFLNKFRSNSSFVWTAVFAPVIFLLATMIVLRGKNSLSSLDCFPEATSCQGVPYSLQDCLIYNMCFWVVPYFVGLHFTYFDKLKLSGFNIVPSKMRRWPLNQQNSKTKTHS